jgi:adenine deaminase
MKMHVVLDRSGEIVAAQEKLDKADGGLLAGPGQKLEEVEVPKGTVLSREDPAQFHRELSRLVAARPTK